MARMLIVRNRSWHCSFTRSCTFERLGPGFQLVGTNQVFCSTHRHAAEMMSHTGGREGGELQAQLSTAAGARQGAK